VALQIDDPDLVERFRQSVQAPGDLAAVVRDALSAWLDRGGKTDGEEDAAPPPAE
jgi:hypothetical protein